jgi:hypothetical protein
LSHVQLDIAADSAGIIIARESWDSVWPEVSELAAEHFAEVDGGIEPKRPLKIDSARMRSLSLMGILQIITARKAGKLMGYCTWQIMPDIESEGLLIAQQGAWFVSKAAHSQRIGYRLFERSIAELRLLGVQLIFPHHRLQGRGTKLGKFFAHFGAKEIQHTYSLWIGDL